MYSLFVLLFQKSYWQMLLRPATWAEALANLKRAHKDKRARQHLLRFLRCLLIPVLCAAYVAWLAGTGALIVIPILFPVLWWRQRLAAKADVSLRITPGEKPHYVELGKEETARLRAHFVRVATLFAVLADRAGSEGYLKTKTLPEGTEVRSRRIHIDLLKSEGLWEEMGVADRDAMLMADGHWTWSQINRAVLLLEPLRLLRWVLRVDFYLPVVGQQLRGDYRIAHELVTAPEVLRKDSGMTDAKLIELGLTAAKEYYLRLLAEGISRGKFEARNGEIAEWAHGLTGRLRGKQSEDLVLGTQLVSEVDDEMLVWATQLAERRKLFLEWALGVVGRGEVPAELPQVFEAKAIVV